MHQSVCAARYCVFGMCFKHFNLIVDYVEGTLDAGLSDLKNRLSRPLGGVLPEDVRDQLDEAEFFEIECVESRAEVADAVAFWSAYFRSLGQSVIEVEGFSDRAT